MRGFFMGAADVVPGVSGGTIALVFGIYRRLVATIRAGSSALGRLLRLDWATARQWLGRVEWGFLIPLVIGIVLAVVVLAGVLETLLTDEPIAMAALFMGLVAGSVVVTWPLLEQRDGRRWLVLIGVTVAMFLLLGLRGGTTEETVGQVSDPAIWAYFLSGAVAICAMILPGISGSFILVLLGMYGPVLGAVNDRDLVPLAVFAIGAVVGLGLFSQGLHWALETHRDTVMAVLIGLMAGSLRVLWPWPDGLDSTSIGAPDQDIAAALALAVVGFVGVLVISRLGRRIEARQLDDAPDLQSS